MTPRRLYSTPFGLTLCAALAPFSGCASVVSGSDGAPLDATARWRDDAAELATLPADTLPDVGADIPCIGRFTSEAAWIQRVYPRSSSRLTGRRPTFRWRGGLSGMVRALEVCRDVRCRDVVARYFPSGDTFTPPEDLPTGVVYWTLRYVDCGGRLREATERSNSSDWERGNRDYAWAMKVPPRGAPVTRSWGAFHDENLDGIEDLRVAARGLAVSLHHGAREGFRAPVPSYGSVSATHHGTFAAVGDLSGEGNNDALIASSSQPERFPPFVGYFGFSRQEPVGTFVDFTRGLITVPSLIVPYTTTTAVAAAGDVNDDGRSDALIGLGLVGGRTRTGSDAPLVARDVPRTWMLYGAHGREWYDGPLTPIPIAPGYARNDTFGYSMTGIGDFNDDGFDDVVISASALQSGMPQYSYGYLGSPRGIPDTPSWSIDLRTDTREFLGNPTRVVGDASGDGRVDFAVPRSTGDGVSIHFFDARSVIERGRLLPSYELRVGPPSLNYAIPFFAVLDANGDGRQDLLVSDGPGVFALYPGTGTWFGTPQRGLRLEGTSVTGAYATADYNGDGYDDLALGDPERARVIVYRGSPAGLLTATPIVLTGRPGFGEWVL